MARRVDYCGICGEHYAGDVCRECDRFMCWKCKQHGTRLCKECYVASIPPLSDSELEVLQDINAHIAMRTRLGLREEEVESSRSTKLSWSNAGRRWHSQPLGRSRGAIVELDANQLIVPYPNSLVKRMVELDLLTVLPLYYRSTEGLSRREAIDRNVYEDVLDGLAEDAETARGEEE